MPALPCIERRAVHAVAPYARLPYLANSPNAVLFVVLPPLRGKTLVPKVCSERQPRKYRQQKVPQRRTAASHAIHGLWGANEFKHFHRIFLFCFFCFLYFCFVSFDIHVRVEKEHECKQNGLAF